jgi:arylsulfatase A-like enzyme
VTGPLTYSSGEPFPGRIGRTLADSDPAFPVGPRPVAEAANVLLIVLDDVGFAQLGCFGSDIRTPSFDALADEGIRYRRFHTTAMCSPTRAALLTGRNSHTVGIGGITELATGFPGYNGRLDPGCGFVAEVLRQAGWSTMAVGKWHLAPAEEQHAAASRDRWPLRQGFERFYGFLGPETSQWAPELVRDNTPIVPIERNDYHLTEDLVDEAIRSIDDLRVNDGSKPFYMYLGLGACHAPHQVPASWIQQYRGAFDDGWDAWRERTHERQLASGIVPSGTVLSARPPWVPAWSSLDETQRKVAARMMEVYAAFLTHTDHHVGRLLDHLRATGELDRTMVMVVSDNGASAEGGPTGTYNGAYLYNGLPHDDAETAARLDDLGGPDSFSNYPWGWAFAGNTPFRRWKRETHEGGISDPLIVRQPVVSGGSRGVVRDQYVHAVDVAATVLDVCGVAMPATLNGVAQVPLAGQSFASSFTDESAPGRTTQYYEQFGSRAIYHDGWKAVAYHPMFRYEPTDNPLQSFDDDAWELYDTRVDPSETNDLAAAEPQRLADLQAMWWTEAAHHGALPLHSFRGPIGARLPPPTRVELRPFAIAVPESNAPNIKRANHRIEVSLTAPADGGHGVLVAQGGRFGGYALYLDQGVLVYVSNYYGKEFRYVRAAQPLVAGRHEVRVEATLLDPVVGSFDVRLVVDEVEMGAVQLPATVPLRFALAGEGLCCGYDDATAVSPEYQSPNRCTATIHRAVVDAAGSRPPEITDEVRRALLSQ